MKKIIYPREILRRHFPDLPLMVGHSFYFVNLSILLNVTKIIVTPLNKNSNISNQDFLMCADSFILREVQP